MRRIGFLLLVCFLAWPAIARADSVAIDFDLGNSTLSFLGAVTIPPDGSITSMGATAVLPAIKTGGGATSVQTGSAQLKNLTISATVDAGNLGAVITGDIFASQQGTVTGPFTNTQTIMFGGGTGTGTGTPGGLNLFVSVHLDCFGLLCGLVGDFPVSIVGTNPPRSGQIFSIMLASLNTPGAANVDGTIPFSFPPETSLGSPTTGTLFVLGEEVSRTYNVPEPGASAQLICGALALGVLSSHRRRIRGVSP